MSDMPIIGVLWLGMMVLAFIVRQVTEFRQPRPTTIKEQAQALALAESLERPMLRLTPAQTRGGSKLGGAPEMPADLDWPVGPEGPLAFVAQIDLAEARAANGPEWLPGEGMLFFFFDECYDPERTDWGADQMVVLFAPERMAAPRRAPPNLEPTRTFNSRRISLTRATSRPSLDWLGKRHLFQFSREAWPAAEVFTPDHRLGGYPAEIQPECFPAECERRREVDVAQTPWRLLLQIDADDPLGMVWTDEGRIFVLIREEDARVGDFSRTITFVQFH